MCFSFLFKKKQQNNNSNFKNSDVEINCEIVKNQNIIDRDNLFDKKSNKDVIFYNQKPLMSNKEIEFYNKLKRVVKDKYIIQTQVNLASIINKESSQKFQNELYRNIDFGIFDNNFNIKLLIELNDSTHKQYNRYQRDIKVREICENAKINLLTLYTDKENAEYYLQKRISEYINL